MRPDWWRLTQEPQGWGGPGWGSRGVPESPISGPKQFLNLKVTFQPPRAQGPWQVEGSCPPFPGEETEAQREGADCGQDRTGGRD